MSKSTKTASVKIMNAQAKAIGHDAEVAENTTSGFEGVYARFNEAREAMWDFFKVPSWKRTLVAFVTSIVVGGGVGFATAAILDWMVTGALAMAVPMFLAVAVWALGALAALYFGTKLAVRVGGAILTGEADERAAAAYDAVRSALRRFNPFVKMQPVEA